jgi:hypothetical protein
MRSERQDTTSTTACSKADTILSVGEKIWFSPFHGLRNRHNPLLEWPVAEPRTGSLIESALHRHPVEWQRAVTSAFSFR